MQCGIFTTPPTSCSLPTSVTAVLQATTCDVVNSAAVSSEQSDIMDRTSYGQTNSSTILLIVIWYRLAYSAKQPSVEEVIDSPPCRFLLTVKTPPLEPEISVFAPFEKHLRRGVCKKVLNSCVTGFHIFFFG